MAAAAALLAAPAAQAQSTRTAAGHVSLVAYSTPNVAFGKLISAFQATPAGKGVSFDQSYGASESQAKSVIAGLPADLADFSLTPDMQSLVKAGLVSSNWDKNQYNGVVTRSV